MTDPADPDDAPQRVVVPHAALAPDVLQHLVEEFVTRDGTDYGAVERTLEEKVAAVLRRLEDGDAEIVVDPAHDTIDIVARDPT